ncbi:hypothetical protein AGDE_03878 [Angomonas deanei]|nr:hypothetical protein AGDE_03878 [Angomonas deanei]|eukprot:EPY40050.1 hypothetical protein AGDE_03878 [Angomonas deanei]
MRDSWPSGITEHAEGNIPSTNLRNLVFNDEAPHVCGTETYSIYSRLGTSLRFGVSATIKLIAVVSDTNPPEGNENLVMASVLNWAVVDNKSKKYYRFSYLDHRSPIVLPNLIAKRQVRGETHLMQAIMEQLVQDELILPDQLLQEPSEIYVHELNMTIGSTKFEQVIPKGPDGKPQIPYYKLHLEGTTHEKSGDDLSEEVTAVVDIEFQPRVIPMLDGVRGVISNGLWEDDKFGFQVPNCVVKSASVRIVRASDQLEVARELNVTKGSVWMDHNFGGVLPRSPEEASFLHQLRKKREAAKVDTEEVQYRIMVRLYNESLTCACVTRFLDSDDKTTNVFSIVQNGKEKVSFGYQGEGISLEPVPSSQYRSTETGILYATQWKLKTPMYEEKSLELTVTACLQSQEFTTVLAFPSFYEGIADVTGEIVSADGSREAVLGDAFITCRGKGKHVECEKVNELYHNAVRGELLKEEVAKGGNWEQIANGPALGAVSVVGVLKKMQMIPFPDEHKMIYGALLGTCGYILHHHEDQEKVHQALEWCYKMWLKYYGNAQLDVLSLSMRSFMLRELGLVMHEKCGKWSRKAVALDIAVPRLARDNPSTAAKEVKGVRTLPSPEQVGTPAAELDVTMLKSVLEGPWEFDATESQGSLVAVLREQNVGVMWRYLLDHQEPKYDITVGPDSLTINVKTLLNRKRFNYPLNGSTLVWRCPARGDVTSNAAVLDEGRTFYVETYVGSGIERTWFFEDEQGRLVEHRNYYPSKTAPTPTASSVHFFKKLNDE